MIPEKGAIKGPGPDETFRKRPKRLLRKRDPSQKTWAFLFIGFIGFIGFVAFIALTL